MFLLIDLGESRHPVLSDPSPQQFWEFPGGGDPEQGSCFPGIPHHHLFCHRLCPP